jgi:hypothetical protein
MRVVGALEQSSPRRIRHSISGAIWRLGKGFEAEEELDPIVMVPIASLSRRSIELSTRSQLRPLTGQRARQGEAR